ncbi:LysM domain/BON superfamily protein [Symmachiella dynata]|uniref:LysM peptidoglycan-binding domain-containing protein n=1 Tax=Symmachiella dynata TaxID=2527995 RepID=UPI00118C14DB|nr:LysM peptidoglycan-binding domain-containing protein [Symmachiella dynata]QDT49406.1 LysM domain/BON superfamily protein [Symmachiella dynata]
MNRELKVPAALAIMLLGFAAMVLWCGKPQDDAGAETAHEDFSDIDAEILDRPHTPHLTGLESPSDAPAASTADETAAEDEGWLSWLNGTDAADADLVSDNKQTATDAASESKQHSPRNQKLITSRPVESGNPLGRAAENAGDDAEMWVSNLGDDDLSQEAFGSNTSIPAPIQSETPSVVTTDRQPRHNEGWDVVAPSVAEELKQHPIRPQVTQQRTYIIQPGDTLSRIAAKFLDGSHRAVDIYEANRDVLANPNQLRVGTKIVIPNRHVAPAKPIVKPNGPVAENPSDSRSERSSSRDSLFVPVSSRPLRNTVRDLSGDSEASTTQTAAPREYKVRRGDSLERIAVKFYGSRRKALDIFRANAEHLSSPNAIREGMTLKLP